MNDVVQAEQATAGIPATTSFFTKGAAKFQRRIAHQISLKDVLAIVRKSETALWLEQCGSPE